MIAGKKKRIVIYGGAFDPPHRGHFALIRAALRRVKPAALYIVPGFRSPFKDFPSAPYKDRAAMLKEGLKAEGLISGGGAAQRPSGKGKKTRIAVHPFEFRRGRLTYTWQTVNFFKKLHPGAETYFLMGSDCLGTFHRWKNYGRILAGAGLLVGRRAGFRLKNPAGAPYIPLRGRFPPPASASLRAELFAGMRPRGLLPTTLSHIARRGLYLGALRRRLKKTLSPRRFAHAESVAALALELALKYGANPLKAALAGLLHDTARGMPPRALAAYAVRHRLRIPRLKEMMRKTPVLLHSYVGADIAAKRFGVRDRPVLNAIRRHTLGARRPDLLSKIIYVADFAAGDRSFPEAKETAALARRDLDAAYRRANYVKLVYAAQAGRRQPESGKSLWNSPAAHGKAR